MRIKLLLQRTRAQDVSDSDGTTSCLWKELQDVIPALFGIDYRFWAKALAQILILAKNVKNKNSEIDFVSLKQC